ncbi:ROK family protein [Kitasatospora sp. NPDC051170]|uniref:ROK family protein n=1 Tax=Kitasatospora sp. NPDC051170 TaxID=3364056 RepID=UPI00379CFA03
MPSSDCVLALDVGGTGMKGAVLDRSCRPLSVLRFPTDRRAVLDGIAGALLSLARLAAERELTVRQVSVVVPGIVEESTGRAVRSVNLGWRDLRLADLLHDRTGLPVTLGHDVRAGGLAESVLGAARGAGDMLFVPIGTGIAAAVFCDGRPVLAGGYAGELGHLEVEPDGAPCACGGRGCLEAVASASAVAAAYTARSGRTVGGAEEVAALLRRGDAEARAVWARAVEGLAVALAAASALLAPELIVLGGGLAGAGAVLLDPVREHLAARTALLRRPRLVRAGLGDLAGCLGAGLYAWRASGEADGPVDGPAGGQADGPADGRTGGQTQPTAVAR